MTNGEAINWIINISSDIGKAEHRDLWHYEHALSEIKEMLETSQPEIIQCKDCKYRYVDGENVRFNVCELNHNKVQSDNWYCADAERREDEQ